MTFKKRAPRAIKEIRAFAQQAMVSNLLFFFYADSLNDQGRSMWRLLNKQGNDYAITCLSITRNRLSFVDCWLMVLGILLMVCGLPILSRNRAQATFVSIRN